MKKLIQLGALLLSPFLFSTNQTPRILELGQYSLAFNEAPELGFYLAQLAKDFGIDTAFETGTCNGVTSIFLSDCFPRVYTVEISQEFYTQTQELFHSRPNITSFHGSSERVLHEVLPALAHKRVLFYLDAHWYDQWPLLDELEEISITHKDNCLLVIDDFKVPQCPEIAFDFYGADVCSLEYIQEKLNKVFTDCTWFYLIPKDRRCAKFVAYPKSWEKPSK